MHWSLCSSLVVTSEVRIEGLETLDYLDNLQDRQRFTEQGDAITFESEVSIVSLDWNIKDLLLIVRLLILWYLLFVEKVDKIYVSTPTKIAILDHEKKRTFVLRKDGLPDAGEFRVHLLYWPHVFYAGKVYYDQGIKLLIIVTFHLDTEKVQI